MPRYSSEWHCPRGRKDVERTLRDGLNNGGINRTEHAFDLIFHVGGDAFLLFIIKCWKNYSGMSARNRMNPDLEQCVCGACKRESLLYVESRQLGPQSPDSSMQQCLWERGGLWRPVELRRNTCETRAVNVTCDSPAKWMRNLHGLPQSPRPEGSYCTLCELRFTILHTVKLLQLIRASESTEK
jgi:hypothetical protein